MNIAPQTFDGLRIAGEKNIVPDADTQLEMAKAGKDRLIVAFKVCLSTAGDISTVNVLKSSGFDGAGKPMPVCTAVTFIYSQTAPPPPPRP